MTRDAAIEKASSCTGKKPLTREIAYRIARKAEADHVHAYKCKFCHQYHIGSSVAPKAFRKGLSE